MCVVYCRLLLFFIFLLFFCFIIFISRLMFVIHPIERCDFFLLLALPLFSGNAEFGRLHYKNIRLQSENERVEVKMRNGLTETKRVLVIQFAFVILFCHIFVVDYFNEMIHHHNRKNDQLKIYNWYILMEVFPVFLYNCSWFSLYLVCFFSSPLQRSLLSALLCGVVFCL